ncbi:TrkH family potassium uptake protein [Nodularia spumigena]|uniref:TrkH family potassium uptake protein n=1 Tax=Nodularia spumigena TaxID=70799 RepID=UPI002B218A12|nr:potassium transporter TrkG [Nodularia spumigena]MEA5556256.1 potassium transporter TrkG [Nodularia spumigena CH309]
MIAMVLRLGGVGRTLDGYPLIMTEALALASYWLARMFVGRHPPMPQDWPASFKRLAQIARGRATESASSALRLIDLPLLLLAIAAASLGLLEILGSARSVVKAHFLLDVVVFLTFAAEAVRMGRVAIAALPGAAALPLSFLLLIGTCTGLLKLPACTPAGITWTDALFTATSAVCVTGLVVRDTASGFTQAGQGVILVFIQLGGLGIVLFGAGLAVMFLRTLSLREHLSIREMLNRESIGDLRRFIGFVLLSTLVIQIVAIGVMVPLWVPPAGQSLLLADRLWLSVFHTVSGFFLAGFELTGSSMVGARNSLLPYLTIMPLIILGGIGFPVLSDLWRLVRRRLRTRGRHEREGRVLPGERLSLHSKLTLLTTAILLALGFIGILIAQSLVPGGNPRPWHGELADAAFMSVTARTAGFNTVPMEELTPASVVLTIAMMFVGGAPGSAAGGMKVTTLALLVLSIMATIRGRAETEAFGRAIPEAIVRKAGAIALSMLMLPLIASFLLAISDPGPLGPIVFEAVSAATTTGLSLGLTPMLSDPGKLIITGTMFLGRIGPLAIMGALIFRRPPSRAYLYPRETINLG